MRASYTILQGFPGGSEVKVSATMRETWVQSLGREDLLEKEMATHSSILAWRIPWMEEPGGLQSMGSQRVGHDWATSLTHSANEEASPTNTNCLESEKIKTKTQPSKAQNDWEGTQGNLLGEKWMFYVVTGLRTPGLHRYSESEVTLSCRTLCNPMDCSLPGSSVHGIFQARVLDWVATAFSSRSSRPRDGTQVSHIVDRCFTVWATREVHT